MDQAEARPSRKDVGQNVDRTGIAGLDEILDGGLPAGRMILVEGDPGTGKTTLAMQYLVAGAAAGEKCLYLSLSQSVGDLERYATDHRWRIGKIDMVGMPDLGNLQTSANQTVFDEADLELSEAVGQLHQTIQKHAPRRLVFDSISEIRLLCSSPLRYRREIRRLRSLLSDTGCSALILDDNRIMAQDGELESAAHGVIRLEIEYPVYGQGRRRLTIPKMRNRSYQEGFHDYVIRSGGLDVFPRASSAEPARTHLAENGDNHIPTGVDGVDDALNGGLTIGSTCLIVGPAGVGKSSLATQVASNLASANHRAAYYLFDEREATFYLRSAGFGVDIDSLVSAEKLWVQSVNTGTVSPGEFAADVRRRVLNSNARVVVIDSITGYLTAMPRESMLLRQLHELLIFLSGQGVLTIIVLASHAIRVSAGGSGLDLSYLADAVVYLSRYTKEKEIGKALTVIKKRSSLHSSETRELLIDQNGIRLGDLVPHFELERIP